MTKEKQKSTIVVIAFLIILALLVSFSICSLSHSGRKAFWRDETYGLESTILASNSISKTIIKGAHGQSSPSPLDYIFIKGVYLLRAPLKYLGLQPLQYFRIHYLIIIWLALLYLFFKIYKEKKLKDIILFSLSSGAFLLNSSIYYYSSEMRPYSLWATLSLVFLFLISRRQTSKITWTVVIFGLSLTTTASLFQLISLLITYYLIEMISQKKLLINFKIDYSWIIIFLGILINFYYIAHIPHSSWSQSATWAQFLKYWVRFIPIIVTGLLLTWHHLVSKDRNKAVATLTGVGWLLFGPISFLLTQYKGYFLDTKQYIYYHPVFFLYAFHLSQIFFTKVKKLRTSRVFVILSIIPFSWVLIKNLNISLPLQSARTVIYGDPISVPVNYQKIAHLIPNKIPFENEFVSIDQYAGTNHTAQSNLNLWWDYLDIIYPKDQYPRDSSSVLRVRARGKSIELLDIVPVK